MWRLAAYAAEVIYFRDYAKISHLEKLDLAFAGHTVEPIVQEAVQLSSPYLYNKSEKGSRRPARTACSKKLLTFALIAGDSPAQLIKAKLGGRQKFSVRQSFDGATILLTGSTGIFCSGIVIPNSCKYISRRQGASA